MEITIGIVREIRLVWHVTSSIAFITSKYFERKYNDDRVWIIESVASDLKTSKKFIVSHKRSDCPHKVILCDNDETYAEGEDCFLVILAMMMIIIWFQTMLLHCKTLCLFKNWPEFTFSQKSWYAL